MLLLQPKLGAECSFRSLEFPPSCRSFFISALRAARCLAASLSSAPLGDDECDVDAVASASPEFELPFFGRNVFSHFERFSSSASCLRRLSSFDGEIEFDADVAGVSGDAVALLDFIVSNRMPPFVWRSLGGAGFGLTTFGMENGATVAVIGGVVAGEFIGFEVRCDFDAAAVGPIRGDAFAGSDGVDFRLTLFAPAADIGDGNALFRTIFWSSECLSADVRNCANAAVTLPFDMFA